MITGIKKYENKKAFQVVEQDVDSITTLCTSISFLNQGEVTAYLESNGTVIDLEPGAAMNHSNDPEVMEVTFYERVFFADAPGIKKLLITREYVNAKT